MSTRSYIAHALPSGEIQFVYCHWDGYPHKGVGQELSRYYPSPDAAAALIALGDMSCINNGEPVAYHRDKGDSWEENKPSIIPGINELLTHARDGYIDYVYLMKDGAWQCNAPRAENPEWKSLAQAIIDDQAEVDG